MTKRLKKLSGKIICFLLLFSTMTGLLSGGVDVHTAEAAEYTYTCPGSYTELVCVGTDLRLGTNYSYYPYPYNVTKSFVLEEGSEEFCGKFPEIGDTYTQNKLATLNPIVTLKTFDVYKAVCPICSGSKFGNWDEGYVIRDSEVEGYYYVTTSWDATNKVLTITNIVPLKNKIGSGGVNVYSGSAERDTISEAEIASRFPTHTYTVNHTCNDNCKELLHKHELILDETEYEYECDGTQTYCYAISNASVPASAMECGHSGIYDERLYYCTKCSEYLYCSYSIGCRLSSCYNYYKAVDENGEYVSYEEGQHPGLHKYKHKGIRYECNQTSSTHQEGKGISYNNPDSLEDYCDFAYDNKCNYCDSRLYITGGDTGQIYFTNIPVNLTMAWSGSATSHYYYVQEPLAGSCYTYGDIHYSSITSTVFDSGSYGCGDNGNITHSYKTTSHWCSECDELVYRKYYDSCSSCFGGAYTSYYNQLDKDERIGDFTYQLWHGGTKTFEYNNDKALHRKKTLTCGTVSLGDKICDKVVVSLTPLAPEQMLPANGTIDTRAYAKFLDGHIELVECEIEDYDLSKFNEWQVVTLKSPENTYASVAADEPFTTTIRVYRERVDFDLVARPQDSAMGFAEGSGSYTVGTDATVSVTEAIGYYFTGWYKGTEKVSGEMQYTFEMPAENLELVAHFAPYVYMVSADVEYPSMGTASVTANDLVVGSMPYKGTTTAKAVANDGFTFHGWFEGEKLLSEDAEYTFEMPAHDLKLLAKFNTDAVKVSFNSDGGSACGPVEVPYLGVYGTLPIPEKDGYVFLCWQLNGKDIKPSTPVENRAAHTLKAVWAAACPEFIMVDFGEYYGDNSWSNDSGQIGKLGLTNTNFGMHLPVPVKYGYSFLNWYRTENSKGNGDALGNPDNEVTKDTIVDVAEEHTLHAGWEEQSFTLSFEPFGGTYCAPMQISYDRTWDYHQLLPISEKSGYTFAGWYLSYLDGNGTGVRINVKTDEIDTRRVDRAEDVKVYARWLKETDYKDPLEVVVTFEPKMREQVGLTVEESIESGYGSTFGSIGAADKERTVAWPGTYGNHKVVFCDCEEAAHASYPVYGGRHYAIDYNSAYEAFPEAARTGYDFNGWEYDGLPMKETSVLQAAFAHTLYAAYTPKTYTVALDGQGADTQTQTKVTMTFDKKVPKVTVPVKEGYLFGGYYTQINGAGTKYYDETGHSTITWDSKSLNTNGTQKVSTLYACWKPMTKISYEPNGGTGTMNPVWLLPGVTSTDILANGFTRSGYSFTGWNTREDGSGTSYYEGQHVEGITSNLTLYAQWEVKTNRIVFRGNGGTGNMADVVTAEAVTSAALPENAFTRVGYTFDHWCTMKECQGNGVSGHTDYADGANVPFFKDTLVLFAQWKEINTSYTLIYMKYPQGSLCNEVWKQVVLPYKQEYTILGVPYTPEAYVVDYDMNLPENMSTEPNALNLTERNYATEAAKFTQWDLYKLYDKEAIATGTGYQTNAVVSKLTETNGEKLYLYPVWTGANSSVILPDTGAEGYEFLGWCEQADGSGTVYKVESGSSVNQDENVPGRYAPVCDTMLYAVWNPLKKKVKLEADCNGEEPGEHVQAEVEFTFDAEAPIVAVPVKEKYVFLGYYTELDSQGKPAAGSRRFYDGVGWPICEEHERIIRTNNQHGTFDSVDVLYAYWIPEDVEVLLDDRGATGEGHTECVKMKINEMGPDIVVPEKRGYSFQGYYTETKGKGERYYNSSGNCVKQWDESAKGVLYAYWVQNPVQQPVPVEQIVPEVLPEVDVEGTLGEKTVVALLYADDYNSETGALTDLQPYIAYDTAVSQGAIPSTEQVAFRAKMGAWLLDYQFHRYSGIDMVRVNVTGPYRTQYEKEDETLVISGQQVKRYSFEVPKVWSYWAVEKSDLYFPDKIVLKNDALKEREVLLKVLSEESAPECLVTSYEAKENHVLWKNYGLDDLPELTLVLEEQYIISDKLETMPEVDEFLNIVCGNAAWQQEIQPAVRSDRYVLAGKEIMPDELLKNGTGAGPDIELLKECESLAFYTEYGQAYRSGLELDAKKENGVYETTMQVVYVGKISETNVVPEKLLNVTKVNALVIHTPVVCVGKVTCEENTSTFSTDDITALFTVEISNEGTHAKKLGYGTKDFYMALSGKSNVAEVEGKYCNMVRFPFDVMVDVGNNVKEASETELDYMVEQGTWIILGTCKQQFYSTAYLHGSYDVECCTIAVNCPTEEDGSWKMVGNAQEYANTDPTKYVATDRIGLEIQGRQEEFRITKTDSQEARQLLQQGQQALTLKKGYGFSYALFVREGILNAEAKIKCTPAFSWVSADGKCREPVMLYCRSKNLDEVVILEQEEAGTEYQCWRGSFSLPEDVLCVALEDVPELEGYTAVQTVTGKERFFKQDGFLVVQFNLEGIMETGEQYVFLAWESTELAEDALNAGWNYAPGDVIRYALKEGISEDYEIGGVE